MKDKKLPKDAAKTNLDNFYEWALFYFPDTVPKIKPFHIKIIEEIMSKSDKPLKIRV